MAIKKQKEHLNPTPPPISLPLPATTTEQEDIVTHGQRRINLIWEITQAIVAISVTLSTLFVSAVLAIKGDAGQAAFLLLSNAFFLVIGFYFSRTNHSAIGGEGKKPTQRYQGR